MALVNVRRTEQFDAVGKQQIAQQIGALYGSLAFMYAKSVVRGERQLESLTPAYQTQVAAIFAYVEEKGYGQVLT